MVFLDADTANIIKDAMRALSYLLCEFIYELIVWMYKVFDRLCNSRILDSTALETIAERVGILLGLIMLFMVVFSVIQMVLEPDKLTDKEKGIGNILKKIILVMVMLGVSSSLFSLMYGIQKKVIASNVIQKFLLPYEVTGNESFGGVLSYNLFTSVYYYNVDNLNVEGSVESLELQHRFCYEGFNKIETRLKNGEKDPFVPIETCVNKKSGDTYIMSFNWLLAPIIGGGVLYFIFSYCISIGIRTIQLAFLEIMAPMAIISYLSPKKDNMFSKWTKLYFATYIDVFLRIMIINLIAFLIMTILESSDKWVFWNSVGGKTGTFADKAIWILMVFALLTFAKKAPELIKELFPSSNASKLGLGFTTPKQLFSNMLGGNYVESGLKRGYGMVAAGFGAWQRNTRKAIGNAITAKKEDRGKMWGRAVGSMLFGGLGGMRRGLMTTNAAGRRQAIDNAYASTQSKYKMRDLGYGAGFLDLAKVVKGDTSGWQALGNQAMDKLRGLGMQDQYIEDMADMKDLSISTYQEQLEKLQRSDTGNQVISKMKSGNGYFIEYKDASGKTRISEIYEKTDASGKVTHVDKDGNAFDVNDNALKIAKLQEKIGKARGDSKKLHQKAEEQKQKSNK